MGLKGHLTCLLRNVYAGEEATGRTGHGTMDWFQIWKQYIKAVYCHPAYLTYMQRRQWHPTPVLLPGKIPQMEEPGGLQSMGSRRVGHDWATRHTHECTYSSVSSPVLVQKSPPSNSRTFSFCKIGPNLLDLLNVLLAHSKIIIHREGQINQGTAMERTYCALRCVWSHWTHTMTCGVADRAHSTGEETKAGRGEVTCLRLPSWWKWQSRGSELDSVWFQVLSRSPGPPHQGDDREWQRQEAY